MEKEIREHLDSIVSDEIASGYRIRDVPAHILKALKEAKEVDPTVPIFNRIRLTKLTPRKRRFVSEAVMKRYHTDLGNADILSNAKLKEINITRGEWSEDLEKRITELQAETTGMMRDLYLEGFNKQAEWGKELDDKAKEFRKAIEDCDKHPDEKKYLLGIFERWINYTPKDRESYTELYKIEQGLENYSPDRDLVKLLDTAPTVEAGDLLTEIEELMDKLYRFIGLMEKRSELYSLHERKSKIFGESVESRRDNAEEFARLYYGIDVLDPNNKSLGPIVAKFDDLETLPDEAISWLVEEGFLFYQGIPDGVKDYLEQWGFMSAERETGTSQPSEGSPDQGTFKAASPQSTETPASSSD